MKATVIDNLFGFDTNLLVRAPKRFVVICEADDDDKSFDIYSEAFEYWQKLKMECFSRQVFLMDDFREVRCTCSPEEFYFGTFYTGLDIDRCSLDDFEAWYQSSHHGNYSDEWIKDAFKSACKIWNTCTRR